MKTYILIFYVFIASLLTFSCGSKTAPNSNIATARSAIINNNFPAAISALNEAQSLLSDSTASPSALTEMAALYCIIDEKMQSDDNIVNALRCYELALSINSDSVKHCFTILTDDEKCQIDKLDKLLMAQNPEANISRNATDSVFVDNNEFINDTHIIE